MYTHDRSGLTAPMFGPGGARRTPGSESTVNEIHDSSVESSKRLPIFPQNCSCCVPDTFGSAAPSA